MSNSTTPVENVLEQTLQNIKSILDVNSVVGDPIVQEDFTIIPISRITLGFVSGGGELNPKIKHQQNFPFAGGSGGGCNISPIGFLVVTNQKIEFIHADDQTSFSKILDLANTFAKSIK